jgi:hypothetical protein
MSKAIVPVIPDDLLVMSERPEMAREALVAMAFLRAATGTRTTSLVVRRKRRTILLGGTRWERLRCRLLGRWPHYCSMIGMQEDGALFSWYVMGTGWTMRIALPEGADIPDAADSWPVASALIDLALKAMDVLCDEDRLARARSLSCVLAETAASAAAQLPEGCIVACPAPPGPLGPEIDHRNTGPKNTHRTSRVVMDRLARDHPPCLLAWFNATTGRGGTLSEPTESRHLGLYGLFQQARTPTDAVERLRALARIPQDETWHE